MVAKKIIDREVRSCQVVQHDFSVMRLILLALPVFRDAGDSWVHPLERLYRRRTPENCLCCIELECRGRNRARASASILDRQMNSSTESFFRAEPIASIDTTIPAALFNRLRLLQSRCSNEHLFVPVRAMQYLAVADADEVIFVDSQAYTVSGGEGGRLIILSWTFPEAGSRDSLDRPVPVRVLYHHSQSEAAQKRMVVEFARALDGVQESIDREGCDDRRKRVIPFPRGRV